MNQQTPIEVAKLLRHNKDLKQRKGLFQNKQVDFFRYKRFLRALNSPAYEKKSANQPDLFPPISSIDNNDSTSNPIDENKAKQIFIALISSQLILPVKKLHSQDLKQHNLKPNKEFPHLIPTDKAVLQPNEYYIWNYNPKSAWDYVIVVGVVTAILALVCYPLWPHSMRRGTYYISLAALWILVLFFVIAIVRLILALLCYPLTRNNKMGMFWLFPNFFEDCGIIESFKPLYGFGDLQTYSHQKKVKRMKRKQLKRERESASTSASASASSTTKSNTNKEIDTATTTSASTKPLLEEIDDTQV